MVESLSRFLLLHLIRTLRHSYNLLYQRPTPVHKLNSRTMILRNMREDPSEGMIHLYKVFHINPINVELVVPANFVQLNSLTLLSRGRI
jgi:hypothetical protein